MHTFSNPLVSFARVAFALTRPVPTVVVLPQPHTRTRDAISWRVLSTSPVLGRSLQSREEKSRLCLLVCGGLIGIELPALSGVPTA